MKNFLITAACGALLLSSCTDPKAQQKALTDDILKTHDKVMDDAGKAQYAKMKLDTLLQRKPELKTDGAPITTELTVADSTMEEWMQKFDPEFKGKSTEEVITYLSAQKKQLSEIDSRLQAANGKAAQFINQHR